MNRPAQRLSFSSPSSACTLSLSDVDRRLLQRCLDEAPQAWEHFVDRFLGLVVHVANHTATQRGLTLDQAHREDLVSEVFLTLLRNDRAVLRRFRRHCSLATYLSVIARRVIVRRLHSVTTRSGGTAAGGVTAGGNVAMDASLADPNGHTPVDRLENREQVEQLLLRLDDREADVVRMYHLEGKSYREIGQAIGLAENSVGSMLSRARTKMRTGAAPGDH